MINVDDLLACAEQLGQVAASVHVTDGSVTLSVSFEGRSVITDAPLGPIVNGVGYGRAAAVVGSTRRTVRESFTAVSGKATGDCVAEHAEVVVAFEESATRWELVVRVAADGVAVRYRLPLLDGVSSCDGERTSLDLSGIDRLWPLDYQTWYETSRFGVDAAALAEAHYGFPLLMRTKAGDYLLVTESGMDGRFSGAHLEAVGGRLAFVTADTSIEVARGDVSPWRVFIVGALATIVETQFVDELAPTRAPGFDFDWVRPGRAAWSWWSDFYSGAQLDHQMRFVDEAAELGWEHLLVDCGWDATWVPEIVAYASRRGIQVHLWAVWRDLNGPENLRKLALWRSWGVAGIKVDFMESESKDRHRWYDALFAEAARVGLMVNIHGSVIPRGWARTWPNLISYEAVRGAEYYVFYGEALLPTHNVILAFTRNVIGAMDYTPVSFGAQGRLTSDVHELALAVAYESGITHFADDLAEYTSRPLVARFLAELAPSWDETRLLAGTPDTEAVIARRHGERWFIGVIATGEARRVRVPLDRLGFETADAWVISDGLVETSHSGVDGFEVDLAQNGGAVAIVTPPGRTPFMTSSRPKLQSPLVSPLVSEASADGAATLEVAADATVRVPPGWAAEQSGQRWTVQAPTGFGVGEVGVVTVEAPGVDRVPVVSHARILPRLTPGRHAVSELPFLAFRNESGPVERNTSNGGGNPADGSPISISGETWASGIGMSAPGWLRIHLGGRATWFSAMVGIDDETTAGWEVFGGLHCVDSASARAIVLLDGVEVAAVDIVSGAAATPITAALIGGGTLELRVLSDGEAHVDWADALITVPAAADAVDPNTGHR